MDIPEISDEDLVAYLCNDDAPHNAIFGAMGHQDDGSAALLHLPPPYDIEALINSVAQEVGEHVEEVLGVVANPLSVQSSRSSNDDGIASDASSSSAAANLGKTTCKVCGGEAAK